MTVNPYTPVASTGYASGISPVTESLTSGSRINRAADDAAGLAVVTGLSTKINTNDVATQNANDGMSFLQTVDGASGQINASLQRMNELSIQAMNGTYTPQQRQMMNLEFQQNIQNINQIAETTNFNGIKPLDGSQTSIDIAMGSDAASQSTLNLPDLTSGTLGLTGLDLTNPANAQLAAESIATAIGTLSSSRSEIGAQQNGLSSAIDNIQSQNVNAYAARSQINDTDFAKASYEQARQNILMQSSIAMQSQGMQSKAAVLQLLN